MSYKNSVLVTGGTLGLGYHAALSMARSHPEFLVIIASRTDPNSAATSINNQLGQKNVLFMPLDLSSFTNIRSFVTEWKNKNNPSIISLILNAGIQFPVGIKYTTDGIEATFGVCHVGHALLFHLLHPFLSPNARIVVTASGTHDPNQKHGLPDAVYKSAEEIAHPLPGAEKISGRQRYATAKLTNILWTYALARRFKESQSNMTVVAFDPGLMPGTGLAREANGIEKFLWHTVLPRVLGLLRLLLTPNVHTPRESGESLAWVATMNKEEGVYFEGRETISSSVDSYAEEKQEDLWDWTVKTVAVGEEERKVFDLGK